jgi:N-acetylmuramoyl-L-alanine amidase
MDAPKMKQQGLIFQIALVVGVALVVATLFTAWTPEEQSGPPPAAARATSVAMAVQPSPTLPPGAPTPTLRNPRLVGLVAGHWKNDSGAVCPDGLKEADLNLEIATRVQKLLTDQGYQVEMLAEFDARLSGYQAAALVSIHNDSCNFIDESATGFKVASAFATRHPELAARLTACLRSRYGEITKLPLHSTSVTPDMSSYHAFNEISELTPAAIIETGFMNRDKIFLTTQTDVVAQGVAAGILCYLRNESVTQPGAPTSVP